MVKPIFLSANYGIILAMKCPMNRKVLLVALLSIICLQASAQAIFTPMKDAVKAGDASELAKYLNKKKPFNPTAYPRQNQCSLYPCRLRS